MYRKFDLLVRGPRTQGLGERLMQSMNIVLHLIHNCFLFKSKVVVSLLSLTLNYISHLWSMSWTNGIIKVLQIIIKCLFFNNVIQKCSLNYLIKVHKIKALEVKLSFSQVPHLLLGLDVEIVI